MGDAGSLLFGGVVFIWLLFAVVAFGGLALSIWMIVDAAQRPDWQFQATGQTKVLWVVLGVVGIAVCQLAGLIAGPIYLLSVRRRLAAAPPPAYGYGYAYGYPPYGVPTYPPPAAYPGTSGEPGYPVPPVQG